MIATPLVKLDGITKRYGAQWRLGPITASIPRGSRIGLIGPNGAGKTTLMSILAGLVPSHDGVIEWTDLKQLSHPTRYSPQDPEFPRKTSVIQLMGFYANLEGFSGQGRDQEVQRVLQSVSLWEERNKQAHALSHGMKKRLSIAQAFLGSRPLVMLDEPTAGLDPRNAQQIRNAVIAKGPNQTILISSHNLSEVESCCDYILVLENGSMTHFDSMEAYTRSGETLELSTESEIAPGLKAALEKIEGVTGIHIDPTRKITKIHFQHPSAQKVMGDVMACCQAHHVDVSQIRKGSNVASRFLAESGDSDS